MKQLLHQVFQSRDDCDVGTVSFVFGHESCHVTRRGKDEKIIPNLGTEWERENPILKVGRFNDLN